MIGLTLTESSLQITSKYVMLSAVICRQNMADYILLLINPHIDVKDGFVAIIN